MCVAPARIEAPAYRNGNSAFWVRPYTLVRLSLAPERLDYGLRDGIEP
jgi:hypothetical protein